MKETMDYKNINAIIAKVLSHEATLDEIIIFGKWVNESPNHKRDIEVLSEFWDVASDAETLPTEISFDRNKDMIFGRKNDDNHKDKIGYRSRKTLVFLSIAASVLIILSLGIYTLINGLNPSQNFVLLTQDNIARYVLPDSSVVVLNKNSRLTYSDRFVANNRKVKLEGEAYFDIRKHNRKRFVVEVGNSEIEVWGTKFNVNACNATESITTTLIEGVVLFRGGGQERLMQPDQQLTYYPKQGFIKNVKVDACLSVEWKDHVSRYTSIPLSELILHIEEHYNVEIVLADKYKDMRVSGALSNNQSLHQTLNVIQSSVGFQWKKAKGKIIIY